MKGVGNGDSHGALVPHLECVTLVGCFFVRWPGMAELANALGELVRVRRGLRLLVLERCTSASVSGDEIMRTLGRDGLEVRWILEEQSNYTRLASMLARGIVRVFTRHGPACPTVMHNVLRLTAGDCWTVDTGMGCLPPSLLTCMIGL